jgi:flagellar hook-associated protein 2
MPDISIPGIKSRFDTEKIVDGLMKVERLPKERIERTNETLAAQKSNWQNLGRRLNQLREDSRLLYSYQNPFNDKSAVSVNEAVLGASVSREADVQKHEFIVKQTAAADRFLSKPLDGNFRVPAGTYTFLTGANDVSFKFSGGSLQEFADTLNRQGQDSVKAGVYAVQKGQKSLLIESLVTGAENRLSFSDDALDLALQTGIVGQSRTVPAEPKITNIKAVAARGDSAVNEAVSGDGMRVPPMSDVSVSLGGVTPSRTLILRFETALTGSPANGAPPETAPVSSGSYPPQPEMPSSVDDGSTILVDGKYVTQRQRLEGFTGTEDAPAGTETGTRPEVASYAPQARVDNLAVIELEFSDGTSAALPPIKDSAEFSQNQYQLYQLAGGKTITGININNDNTHRSVDIRNIQLFDPRPDSAEGGVIQPLNAISTAQDAVILMDGIEIQRPSNTIDDLIPGVTLNPRSASETPVGIDVEVDTEAVKDAVITLVGDYNRLMSELNVLTRNDESVVRELSYLSPEEQDDMLKRLGVFSTDSELLRFRGRLQQIMTAPYTDAAGQEHLLSSFGITTDARRGSGYDPTKMRGYLEINEAAFDEALKTSLNTLHELFGRDSDGDLIVDSGLAYSLAQAVQPYVELGGIIAARTSTIDSRLAGNERRIETLDRQLTAKEQTLKIQYNELEEAYSRMERMSNSFEQFNRQSGGR